MSNEIIVAVLVTFFLTSFIFGFLYYCLHDRITVLEEKANATERHYKNLVSLERFIKIVAVIGVLFCLFPSIHHLYIFFPKMKNVGEHLSYLQEKGIDYWGIIVGFLTLMVTLLVAWNIYSTLKAKDDLNKYRKNLNQEVKSFKYRIEKIPNQKFSSIESRLSEFDECCKNRGQEIESLKITLAKRIDNIEAQNLVNTAKFYMDTADKAEPKYKIRLYEDAYRTLVEALYLFCRIESSKSIEHDTIALANCCLKNMSDLKGMFSEVVHTACLEKLNILVYEKTSLRKTLKEEIKKLITAQTDVGYLPTMDGVINYVMSVQKRKDSPNSSF